MNKPLSGRIALVAGATRGAGRGIATALGEAGATVWCTGRSTRGGLARPERPETIEDAAEAVDAAGGQGIPVVCDHTDPAQVEALAQRIRVEHGGLDLVVDNVWGCESVVKFGVPVWELDLDGARKMLDLGIWTHLVSARHLSGLLLDRERPLWVEVTDGDHFGFRGCGVAYDLVKMAGIRLAFGLSRELAARGVTALAITPGYLRSEEMLTAFGVTEATWRDAIAKVPDFAASESPRYVGRAVAALAAEPDVARRTGRVFASWDIAREHDLRDLDGSQPHWAEHFTRRFGPYPHAGDAAFASWEAWPLDPVTGAATP